MEVKLNNPAAFGSQFVALCLQQGFQSLTKRDLELLIFMLLELDGAIQRDETNYAVARKLRLTVAKVRALRRDSYARWRPLLREAQADGIKRILRHVLSEESIEKGAQHASEKTRKEGFLATRVEHPDDLAELEQAILDAGGIPVYERNREVLVVRFDVLIRLAELHALVETDLKKARRSLSDLAPGTEELEGLLKKDVTKLRWSDLRSAINALGAKAVAGTVDLKVAALLKIALPFLS